MDAKVAVFGTLRFPPDQVSEILPHLWALVESTCENDGCIAYDAAEDPFDSGLIRFSELWPNQELLDKHLMAPHIAPWREVAKKCGLIERQFTAFDISGARSV